ncbi:MAG: F0F1 ATP synthase subunit B [Planctomycetota bacterium]|jgi:F-type H+-transporting ATPase subunit b
MFNKGVLIAVCLSVIILSGNPLLASEGGDEQPSLFSGNLGNAIWTLLIFIVVIAVLGKYAWGPLLRGLQQREDFIRESLSSAKHDREEAESRLAEYEQKLTKAEEDASAVLEAGRREGDKLKREIEEQARSSAEQMVERAKREINVARDDALKELYGQASELAMGMAGNMLKRQLTPEDDKKLIQEALAELGKRSDIQN